MSGVTYVYKTTKPDIVALVEEYKDERKAAAERLTALLRSFDPDDRLTAYGRFGWFGRMEPKESGDTFVPEGFRVIASGRIAGGIVPDKRTKAGRAAYEAITEWEQSCPRDLDGRLPGMPGDFIVDSRWYHPAVNVIGGAVYVAWGSPVDPAAERPFSGNTLDLDIWEPVPLSVYYALVEAIEKEEAK